MVDSLLDGIVPMLEQMAYRLDDLEEAALRDPRQRILSRAYLLRNNSNTATSCAISAMP
jgi:magnesium transporter